MKADRRGYQPEYSSIQPEATFDLEKRRQKALKIIAVLSDRLGDNARHGTLIDIGCSIGVSLSAAGGAFKRSIGLDIDRAAASFAHTNYASGKVVFLAGDCMDLPIRDSSADAVICSHVYEHVPDPHRMMAEIHRILKPGGICYFAAGNLLQVVEPHYRIPFLSLLPRPLADALLRVTGKGTKYYEKHMMLRGLKRMVWQFYLEDYTIRIIQDPERFEATDMVRPGSLFQGITLFILRLFYWACPTYIWILEKREQTVNPPARLP